MKMFGFFKELAFIGVISSALGKMVIKFCGYDYLGQLSNKDRNKLAEDTISIVERLHEKKFSPKSEDLPFDDMMVTGFMLLAIRTGAENYIDHKTILIGLMDYLNACFERNDQINPAILSLVKSYLDEHPPT
jgi:hypothetical protein